MNLKPFERHMQVVFRDFLDVDQTRYLDEVVDRVCQQHNLKLEVGKLLFVPYSEWKRLGGTTALVPTNVRIVHGLVKPTVGTKVDAPQRYYLVSDQASETKLTHRVHLCSFRCSSSGVKPSSSIPYCGQASQKDKMATDIAFVTCPECLLEISEINTKN